MAISTMAVWRVRIDGNDLNGGAFDSSIVGAGTDYSDQASAQLSLTDLATVSASAAVSSASGGFTAAMIGNAVRIASGTNFTAGTYFIAAVTDANNATLDRTCCTAAASAGVAKVGGAKASVSEPVARGAIAGNTVMIRGQGSEDPIDIDYGSVSVTTGSGIAYVGYNGRPKLSHNGRCFYSVYVTAKNLFFVQIAGTSADGALVSGTISTPQARAIDCVFDTAGYDTQAVQNYTLYNCTVMNSGAQIPVTTRFAVNNAGGGGVINCHIKDQRGRGIYIGPGHGLGVLDSIIQNCSDSGIVVGANGSNPYTGTTIANNTIYDCGGHGIESSQNNVTITKNLICNITGEGKYGLYATYSPTSITDHAGVSGNNYSGCTNNSNLALSPADSTLDPQFANAPDDLTPTNTALRYIDGVGV